jgi:hypothetical protein
MTAEAFIAKWSKVDLTERSAAQAHFLDLCELVGHPKPQEADPKGEWFTFERGASKQSGGDGWADVWKKDFFGWEYKGRHKDLDATYDQLLEYRADLNNPPLLVVCDMDISHSRPAISSASCAESTIAIILLGPLPMTGPWELTGTGQTDAPSAGSNLLACRSFAGASQFLTKKGELRTI